MYRAWCCDGIKALMQLRLPPIMQIAYLVEDLDAAMRHWAETLRVGPFFVFPHVDYVDATYMGEASKPDISLAFAFSGELQIELVQQHNDAPSIFRAFHLRHGYGAQHLGAISDELEVDARNLETAGVRPIQRLLSRSGAETLFFSTALVPGETLELIRGSSGLHERFAAMKRAAREWDGVTPRAQ